MKKVKLLCIIFILCFLQLSCGIVGPSFYVQWIHSFIWSPDGDKLYFSYVNYQKIPGDSSIELEISTLYEMDISRKVFHKINVNPFDYDDQRISFFSTVDPKFVGWWKSKFIVIVGGAVYSLDVVSGQMNLLYNNELLWQNGNCLIGDYIISTYYNNGAKSSYPLKINNDSVIPLQKQFEFESTDNKKISPEIIDCSSDGKYAYYEVNSSQQITPLERGIAEIDLEKVTLKNPKPISNRAGFKGWLASDTFVSAQIVNSPTQKDFLKYESVAYPSGEKKDITEIFSKFGRQNAFSPDFKKVIFIEDETMYLSNSDGTNKQVLLNIANDLPKGELKVVS